MVKFKELHIKNFQSIKECTIHFDENGVYHIAGKHNIGKSAIVKAINSLLQNVSRLKYKYYIRDNENSFEITGKFYDGGVVKLVRGENDMYEWNLPNDIKGTYPRTDGQVPEELEKYFNLYIDMEKTKECLNIRTPRSKLPFVDMTVSDNYYLLQKALRTEEFVLATRLATKKKNEFTRDIRKARETRQNEQDAFNREAVQLGEIERQFKREELLYKNIQAQTGRYEQLKNFASIATEVTTLRDELNKLNVGEDVKTKVATCAKEVELLTVIQSIIELTTETENLKQEIELTKEISKSFEVIDKKQSKQETIVSYQSLYDEVETLTQEIDLSKKIVHLNKETVKEYLTVSSIDNIVKANKELGQIESDLQTNKDILNRFNSIEPIKKQIDGLDTLFSTLKEYQQLGRDKKRAEEEHLKADKELTDFMKEHSFCPIVAMTIDQKCPFGEVL